ncbi:MAG TPA: alpha-amylase family glycosyl hydrolase [Verrucomicrobiae bacterium]|nr:alpha-amylase family glycosyl hydrolase [Verrucomicrobiae bacterium]
MSPEDRIRNHLNFLYGPATGERTFAALSQRLAEFRRRHPRSRVESPTAPTWFTERDVLLITYGDQIAEPGRPPLQTLAEFLETHAPDALGGVHLLPYFPYSSDDGFSVIDYRQVNPRLGDWTDVERLGKHFRLMFDAVINHVSRESAWFQAFLRGQEPYTDYFITCDPRADLSAVVRPRTLPLLTAVETAHGLKHVWTTFSDDQIDLNYQNPRVLLEIVDVLLLYVERGATVIRLDAIAYLWKEIGTRCIHLPQTHRMVKLFRAVFDAVAPRVQLITETNVPHEDNIRYFGDGTDEAQMVYNFALPPLVLHTFRTGNARVLSQWAATLVPPSPTTTFFNFIASHDGIGVVPARGLLSEREIDALVDLTESQGGKVSYKTNSDGSRSPYELNTTLFDALNSPGTSDASVSVRRFLASQAIMLSLAGVPGVYIHSLFGSRNWHEGVNQTGRARTINRQKFQRASLEAELAERHSLAHGIFHAYRDLLRVRRSHPAFHPNAPQKLLTLADGVFGLVRTAPEGGETVVALVNVTARPQPVAVDLSAWGLPATNWRDLISGETFAARNGQLRLETGGYQSLWLQA